MDAGDADVEAVLFAHDDVERVVTRVSLRSREASTRPRELGPRARTRRRRVGIPDGRGRR